MVALKEIRELEVAKRMELVLFVEKDKGDKLERLLRGDEEVSKANILFHDSSPLGKEGFYVRILGTEEQCEKARELSKDIAEVVEGEEKERVLELLKDEDYKMLSGFSGIFK